jgi:electron transport complex protein RnfC
MSSFRLQTSTFRHGVHPDEHKDQTEHLRLERMPFVDRYIVPLRMNLGGPCAPVATPGQDVERGQVIGTPTGFVSTTLHSPVTGRVSALEPHRYPNGEMVDCFVIEADPFSPQQFPPCDAIDWRTLSLDEFIEHVQKAGLVGLGGAAFPSHVKYKLPEGRRCQHLVINGCECEPYLTSDHRLPRCSPRNSTRRR